MLYTQKMHCWCPPWGQRRWKARFQKDEGWISEKGREQMWGWIRGLYPTAPYQTIEWETRISRTKCVTLCLLSQCYQEKKVLFSVSWIHPLPPSPTCRAARWKVGWLTCNIWRKNAFCGSRVTSCKTDRQCNFWSGGEGCSRGGQRLGRRSCDSHYWWFLDKLSHRRCSQSGRCSSFYPHCKCRKHTCCSRHCSTHRIKYIAKVIEKLL